MNETMKSKLARLLASDDGIYQVDILMKCKTRDGMIYTLDVYEIRREDAPKETPEDFTFGDYVHSTAVGELLRETELIESGEGYCFSMDELVSVKNSEIIRVWAELGHLHTTSMPKE